MVKNWWREVAEVALFGNMAEVVKAQRMLAKSRRLRRQGRLGDAFTLAVGAFGILQADSHAKDPAARALVATEAVFLDELARELGHCSAARDDLAAALEICEDVAKRSPRLEARLREYVEWYRYRIARIEQGALN